MSDDRHKLMPFRLPRPGPTASAVAAAVLTALAIGAGAASASHTGADKSFDPTKDRETHLLSRAAGGGFPNGPSRNGAFSQDRQLATRVVYESDASDIVARDTNGVTDVFMVIRSRPYDSDGPPWRANRTVLISQGMGAQPANGPSYGPDIDGEQLHAPSCVAFVSAASNLVPGDTNGKPDAFVKDLRTGRITRVSVNSYGHQSDGATYEVKVDGACHRVAFSSDASNLALTDTRRPAWKRARTTAPPPGTVQVYVRVISNAFDNRGLKGLTFLASASRRGQAGNGNSYQPVLARSGGGCPKRCGLFSAEAVFFTSEATNLAGGDSSSQQDVYKRSFTRRFKRLRFPLVRGVGGLRLATRLVSANARGRAGNGASSNPATHDQGRYVAFQTEASDLLPGDDNNVMDVARADTALRRIRYDWVSKSAAVREPGNGPSGNPTMTRPGSPVFFDSDASNLQPNRPSRPGVYHDRNGVRDMFFWNIVSGNVSLNSRDSNNEIMGLPETYRERNPDELAPPSHNPATSYYGNYVLFETANPLVDLPMARNSPDLSERVRAARNTSQHPALNQVYLRYIGPR